MPNAIVQIRGSVGESCLLTKDKKLDFISFTIGFPSESLFPIRENTGWYIDSIFVENPISHNISEGLKKSHPLFSTGIVIEGKTPREILIRIHKHLDEFKKMMHEKYKINIEYVHTPEELKSIDEKISQKIGLIMSKLAATSSKQVDMEGVVYTTTIPEVEMKDVRSINSPLFPVGSKSSLTKMHHSIEKPAEQQGNVGKRPFQIFLSARPTTSEITDLVSEYTREKRRRI